MSSKAKGKEKEEKDSSKNIVNKENETLLEFITLSFMKQKKISFTFNKLVNYQSIKISFKNIIKVDIA